MLSLLVDNLDPNALISLHLWLIVFDLALKLWSEMDSCASLSLLVSSRDHGQDSLDDINFSPWASYVLQIFDHPLVSYVASLLILYPRFQCPYLGESSLVQSSSYLEEHFLVSLLLLLSLLFLLFLLILLFLPSHTSCHYHRLVRSH